MTRPPLGIPYNPPWQSSDYITKNGANLIYRGKSIKLYGCTVYLSTQGGAATWQAPLSTFKPVFDSLLQEAKNNGLSMIRITDFWDGSHITPYDDPTLWTNIDYAVTAAQQYGMFIMMDISAYQNVIDAAGGDHTVASSWTLFLQIVGRHYGGTAPSICWYNCLGEPSVPADQAGATALGAFYETLCSTLHSADGGTHLISAGGLTHMNQAVGGLTDPAWWYATFNAPHNDIMGIKEYSTNDLAYMTNINSIVGANGTNPISKPISVNEFGTEQEQGDLAFTPAFSNSLSAGITSGNPVTSLSLNTTISVTVPAGTIISVSNTENFVVSADTSSGTSLPVQSVTAQQNHSINDAMVAKGFADNSHSLADTTANFYQAVWGGVSTILKWNNAGRTLVPTSVLGGTALGVTSYVMWNLGEQVQGTGYDTSADNRPGSWGLYGAQARIDSNYQTTGFQTVMAASDPYGNVGSANQGAPIYAENPKILQMAGRAPSKLQLFEMDLVDLIKWLTGKL